ncbi:cupin domain-containing protein [Parvibaculum sp.]|uniref:cupin domain-containing protein n=1 Tax=Parvibaculum sp. TaxID=2024848 RepID=UPI000C59457A|nr:cupin domain-containing protein [Parvibaculum sp.]HAC56864.1 cupin [Rhodobiaceae bacterium]MAU59815.1 cupin [Parvibaculum sp.]MBO6667680.1 cupin domain-containing protein [Parvibaculum sp.]MBO6692887.1 cupin domain-containing protein [Parvibaculum sp.]MBO6715235.1 cupin domain-containing protein [Parvibaculum sp.]
MPILPVPFDITEIAPEKGAPDPARVLSGKPRNRVWNLYSSPDGKFFSGIWESEPGEWRIEYTEHEFCHILEGVSRITPAGGEPMTVRQGDAFVIPAGFKGVWEVVERTRKHYAIYEA